MSRVILSYAKDLALGLCRRLYEIFHCVQDDKHRGIRIMGNCYIISPKNINQN